MNESGNSLLNNTSVPNIYNENSNPLTGTDATLKIPPVPSDIVIKFLAAGDNIIHESVYLDAKNRARSDTPEFNFIDMYDGIADLIKSADIAFVNQETPIAGSEYGYSGHPNFNSPREAGDTLVDLGFDIINIANNHMLDKKEIGLLKTIEYWETKDVLLLGAFRNAEDYDKIRVYEEHGVKIAFLTYTYSTNGMTLDIGSKHIIPMQSEVDLRRQILLAKEAGDLVFVSMHWGNEDEYVPSSTQKYLAQIMVDMGVDVIIGHHPHVVQPIIWAENADGHRTLIIYSLGNLISTMHPSYNMVGMMVTFDIIKEPNEQPYVDNPLCIPVMCHYNTDRRGLQVYLLEDYTPELAAAHGSQLIKTFTFESLRKIITDNIAPEFLSEYYK